MNLSTPRLVQVIRREAFDESPWYGYLWSESESLLLLQYVSDRYDFDGYRCIRRKDLADVLDEFPRRDLIERAMRLKGLIPRMPSVSLGDDIRDVMIQIPIEYEIIAIHRELECPDECEIGKIRESDAESYTLDWMTPDAEWLEDDRPFRFGDATRLDFDDEYAKTLLIVSADRNGG